MNLTTDTQNQETELPLALQKYQEQLGQWPAAGKHILAQYDDDSIVVYQAYRPSIAAFAVQNQRFGGDFSFNRMSWIKPNFLWMMYRSGWASKEGQERILAIRLKRAFFEEILGQAVASSFEASGYPSHDEWKERLSHSEVRMQWDPDHDPMGRSVERRAIQLGLRGNTLRRFGHEEHLGICDITPLVLSQAPKAEHDQNELWIPEERVFIPSQSEAVQGSGITI